MDLLTIMRKRLAYSHIDIVFPVGASSRHELTTAPYVAGVSFEWIITAHG